MNFDSTQKQEEKKENFKDYASKDSTAGIKLGKGGAPKLLATATWLKRCKHHAPTPTVVRQTTIEHENAKSVQTGVQA